MKSTSIADEFTAALEAATGQSQPDSFQDPMDEMALLEAYNRLLVTPRADRGLQVLARTGVLEATLPEAFALVGFGDGVRHKDVWLHTLQVVRQSPTRLVCRWGALLHDVGKVPTRRFTPEGTVTFIGHPEIGARMFDRIAKRLPFPEEVRNGIRFLIAAHLRGSAYKEDWTDSAVRRFIRDAGPDLDDLMDLARADITSKYPEKVLRGLQQIHLLAQHIDKVSAEDAKPAPLPKGLGAHLIKELRIVPGPGLGRIMDALAAEVDAGQLEAGGPFQLYTDYLSQHPALLELSQ